MTVKYKDGSTIRPREDGEDAEVIYKTVDCSLWRFQADGKNWGAEIGFQDV